jgi:hypothetical protein
VKTPTLRREQVGITVHNPWTTPIPAAGCLRTHDCDINLSWNRVERQRGVYDWADFDRLAEMLTKRGLTLIFTVIGTPAWCASSRRRDAYGATGGASMPNELHALRRFTFEAVRRYNVPRKPRLITMVEAWNEPAEGDEDSCFFEPCVGEKKDWLALARVEDAIHAGAHAADPGVLRAMPSMTAGHPEHLAEFLAVGGGGSADVANVHAYGHVLRQIIDTDYNFRDVLRKAGKPGLPIAWTECGHQPRWKPEFLKLSPDEQRKEWAEIMLYLASQGYPAFVSYSVDPGASQVERGEVYPMAGKAWGDAPGMVLPHVGKKIRKAVAWSLVNRAWVIGGRTVRL